MKEKKRGGDSDGMHPLCKTTHIEKRQTKREREQEKRSSKKLKIRFFLINIIR